MGQVCRYAERINLAAMKPDEKPSQTRYCLAERGRKYLAFKVNKGEFTWTWRCARGLFRGVVQRETRMSAGEAGGGRRHAHLHHTIPWPCGAVPEARTLKIRQWPARLGVLGRRRPPGPGVLHQLTGVIARPGATSVGGDTREQPPEGARTSRSRRAGPGRWSRICAPGGRAPGGAGQDAGEDLRQAHHHHGRGRAGGAGGDRRDLRSGPAQHPGRTHLGGHHPAGWRADPRGRGARRCAAAARRRWCWRAR